MLGGNFNVFGNKYSSLDTLNASEESSLNFMLAPNFGYFVKDNLALGLRLNLGGSFSKRTSENTAIILTEQKTESVSQRFGIGVFA